MTQNRENWDKTIQERIAKNKAALLEQFRKMPILQIALERSSVSRSTYYNWCDEDLEFKKNADQAIVEGESLISDMSEGQLISLIRDKHFPAVQLWLRQHHPKYSAKVEISGNLKIEDESLTSEQQELVTQALKLAGLGEEKKEENHDTAQQSSE